MPWEPLRASGSSSDVLAGVPAFVSGDFEGYFLDHSVVLLLSKACIRLSVAASACISVRMSGNMLERSLLGKAACLEANLIV